MSIRIDVGGVAKPGYKPVSILGITVPVPIAFVGNSLDVQRVVWEELGKGHLDKEYTDVNFSTKGQVFRTERGGYSYNVWYLGSLSGIGGGWNDDDTFEGDVETFKRFPSCVLLMEDVFYQRIQRMATAAGSTIHRFDFHKPELLRAA